ncbi:MAG: hypothetical protein WC856_03880 [Methylococcaceae bacterium]|jgi:hypothetical protein
MLQNGLESDDRPKPLIDNCYSAQRNLFSEVFAGFIGTLMPIMSHLNPEFQTVVNAQFLL